MKDEIETILNKARSTAIDTASARIAALSLYEQPGDRYRQANAAYGLAMAAQSRANLTVAAASDEQAAALLDQAGDQQQRAGGTRRLGAIHKRLASIAEEIGATTRHAVHIHALSTSSTNSGTPPKPNPALKRCGTSIVDHLVTTFAFGYIGPGSNPYLQAVYGVAAKYAGWQD